MCRYQVVDVNDFYDWGVLNLGGKKITLSENNLLPLEAGNDKYQIQNDQNVIDAYLGAH